ncbi:MAG: hypothetical protein ACPG77_08610, partial [Nannocystaceae bacterium]
LIGSGLDGFMKVAGEGFEFLGEFVGQLMEQLGPMIEEIWPEMESAIGVVFETLKSLIDPAISAVKGLLKAVKPILKIFKALVPIVGGALASAFESIGAIIGHVGDALSALLSGNFADAFASLGRAILSALLAPLKFVARELVALADSLGASSIVPNSVRRFAGADAPSGPDTAGAAAASQAARNDALLSAGKGATQIGAVASLNAGLASTRSKDRLKKPGGGGDDDKKRGGGGKRAKSKGLAAIEKDISGIAEARSNLAFQQAIQAGATTAQANREALAVQKQTIKDLSARSGELARKGLLGRGVGSVLAGGQQTAGGAIPIALDLANRSGGPPPVQINQIGNNPTFDIDISEARFDSTMAETSRKFGPAIAEEIQRMWARLATGITNTSPSR